MYFKTLRFFSLMLISLLSPALCASEEQPTGPNYAYYQLMPDITTNYYTQGKQLGYVRVQVHLMVLDPAQIPVLEHHDPLIRDAIIEVLGREGEATVKSLAGLEQIRQQCLDTVNELLVAETGQKIVKELLFTSFLNE
uniref:flagellar basal body-associated protein FliL n=1 Tax=Thaumasiovibrio occultus TaxID=1891184 RepID=UPI000B352106|nr:flagellar basal body-associated protein FliL [Thaumasiovibrio occultus]